MRHDETREVQVVELGVAIRQGGGIQDDPGTVKMHQIVLKVGASQNSRAGRAAGQVEPPVKVYHHPAPSGLMQPVHVLGEQHLAPTAGLKPGEGVVRMLGKA